MIQAKFSGSIRRQPAWRSLGPILFSSETYSFQGSSSRRLQSRLTGSIEHDTIPFDLALPSSSHTDSVLHVLLLWSSDGSKHNLERLQSRVPKIARLGDHQVALLVGDGSIPHDEQHIWQQFSILQNQVPKTNAMPLTLALSAEAILHTLERYMKESDNRTEAPPLPHPMLTALVAQATTTAPVRPLSEHDAAVLANRFPSIQCLEEATRTDGGKRQITQLVGAHAAKEVIDFWQDEWIA
ncbi:hypothetical protein PV11_01370 [Exophiala sideris]|uniref:Uncharacterized protein n=1 Tax=Exophiala sideris TaxID=1016849 RepID=A0A0D1YVZ2_9EURO|nr:hypothetical protein PV11_01370 [Exophiala sideris]